MNKNLYNYPTKEVSHMTASDRRDLRLLLALPDSINNLKKSVEEAIGREKERLENILRQNEEEYDRLLSLHKIE